MNTKTRTVPDVYVSCKNPHITNLRVDIFEEPVDIFLNFTKDNEHDSVSILPEIGYPITTNPNKTALLEPISGVLVALVYLN